MLARDRVLSARGLDTLLAGSGEATGADGRGRRRRRPRQGGAPLRPARGAVRRTRRVRRRKRGGPHLRESRPARTRPDPAAAHTVRRSAPPGRTGAHPVRGVATPAPARPPRCCSTSRPTTSTPTRSGWLREFLQNHTGGLVVISHNVDLLADVVNRVWFLDAVRGEADVYNMGWQKYLDARATDEQRRRRERANAEKKASALRTQAAKMGAKATKAVAAQNMLRRADRMMADLDDERVADKVARIKFPTPGAVRAHPVGGQGPDQDLRLAGDLHRRRPGHRPRFPRRGARPQRCGQDHAAAAAGRGRRRPTPGRWNPATASRSATSPRSTTPSTTPRRCGRTSGTPHPTPGSRICEDCWARSCSAARSSTSRRARCPAARRPAWRWPAWSRRRPTCCCSTSRPTTWTRRRVSRCSTRCAATSGAVVLVTHDPGAAEALDPQRVVLLPDGTEDFWSDDYRDLIELA